MKRTMSALVGVLLTSGLASAQITVVNTQTANFGPVNGGAFSFSYQVQNPNDVVVAGFYVDAGGGALSGLSFGAGVGNQAANGLITSDRSSLAYFLNPSTSTGLSFNGITGAADNTSAGYFIWELSGVNLSASVQSTTGADNTTQIATTAANSFITDILGVNDFGITDVSPTAGSIQTEVGQTFVVPGGGQLAGGQATAGAAGTYNLGWDVTGGSGNYGELAYAFTPAAVPEPTSLALGAIGMGFLALVRRNRKI